MKEQVVQFGKFKTLLGVIHEPTTSNHPSTAVVLSNAGLIHRIGPNRVYVKLARHLATQGIVVLRFDLSGVGDSQPRPDHLPVEEFTIDDTVQAINYLAENYGTQQFVLMGHCAGAYHSIRTANHDARVQAVVMINPDGGEAEWIEYDRKRKTARYYENYYGKRTLLNPANWKRFFTGQVSYSNIIRNLIQNVLWNRISGIFFKLRQRFAPQPPPLQSTQKLFSIEPIIQQLYKLETRVLLIYTEGSTSLERIRTNMGKAIKELEAQDKLQLAVIPNTDHIFSTTTSQKELIENITKWMKGK